MAQTKKTKRSASWEAFLEWYNSEFVKKVRLAVFVVLFAFVARLEWANWQNTKATNQMLTQCGHKLQSNLENSPYSALSPAVTECGKLTLAGTDVVACAISVTNPEAPEEKGVMVMSIEVTGGVCK